MECSGCCALRTGTSRDVRGDVRDFVVEHLGDPGAVLAGDETGFLKKGIKSAGVQRQYSGTAGRTENCQIGVFLAYASRHGHALIDRELYIPESWISDGDRCRDAGIPDSVQFATKPRQLVAEFDDRTWQRLSVGAGAHGPREHDWAHRQIEGTWATGRGHWLLARRSISNPTEIAYYVCYGPASSRLIDLAWTAGSRWHVEEAFSGPKAKPDSTTTRYADGGPGTPTSLCPCSLMPGSQP